MKTKIAFDEVLVGVGGGALSSYLIAGAASVPMTVAAPVGMLVGGVIYGLYKAGKNEPNVPGLTPEQINADLAASAGTMALAMLFAGAGIKEQFSQALVLAAENAVGGKVASAVAAKTGGLANLLVMLGMFVAGTAMVFMNVFVIGDKLAEWLKKNK